MATVIYPTQGDIAAPWLIDSKALDQLDALIHKQYRSLVEARNAQVKAAVHQEFAATKPEYRKPTTKAEITRRVKNSYPFSGENCGVTLLLPKDRKAKAASFEELRKDPALKDELPLGFTISISVGRASIEITLGEYSRDRLRYDVKDSDPSTARDATYSIDSWIQTVRLPLWQRIWKKIQGVQLFLAFFLLVFALVTVPDASKQYKADLQSDVGQILQIGVSAENLSRAVQLILTFTSDYVPPRYNSIMGPFWKRLGIVGGIVAFLGILVSFPPRTSVAIGRGVSRVRFWRFYTRLISITIPTGIILPIVLNQVHLF